ncbi:hypothetical protein E2651_19940 [Streptomyces sp. MZ04]|nr:hypothetical protein E2651_19940 [Streptomyces sp. MZ04]
MAATEGTAAGRAPWQVLAGAAEGAGLSGELLYEDAPYGVGHLVASRLVVSAAPAAVGRSGHGRHGDGRGADGAPRPSAGAGRPMARPVVPGRRCGP